MVEAGGSHRRRRRAFNAEDHEDIQAEEDEQHGVGVGRQHAPQRCGDQQLQLHRAGQAYAVDQEDRDLRGGGNRGR